MKAVTAEDIRAALETTYTSPEWYIGFEVGNSTGANCKRHADAVAINAYPSKGFEARGFEIKVSKQDLKAELENGIKSDEIARFCDYWFLVVPKGLTDGFVLPPTWGVIEYDNGKLRQKQKAERLERLEPTSGFLCAMLRGREKFLYKAAQRVSEDREKAIREDESWSNKYELDKYKKLQAKLKEIFDATGIYLDDWTPAKDIIDRLKAAMSLRNITKNIRDVQFYAEEMLRMAKEIKTSAEGIYSPEEEV